MTAMTVNLQRKPSNALVLALISIPIFIGALDLTVVSAVLPHVIYDLEIPVQTNLDDAAWLVTGYLLAYSVAMTFMGRLSDLHGRRRVYLLALLVFALGSYLVAVGEGWPTRWLQRGLYLLLRQRSDPARIALHVLIAARMIQAFGGGAMVPVGMAMVGDLYPEGKRARPLGVIAAVDTAGWVVGHLYGGIIVRYYDWQTIFWINLPVCALAFMLIWSALRHLEADSQDGRMDWLGTGLIALSLTTLNLGLGTRVASSGSLQNGQGSGLPDYAAPMLAGACVLFGLFIWRQARARWPLVPLGLFRRANYSSAGFANFLVGFSLFVAIANVPLFINTLVAPTLQQGAWDSGWMLSALTVPMAVAAIPGGWWAGKSGYRWPAMVGLVLSVIGFGFMSRWEMDTSYWVMAPHLTLTGVGFGLTLAPLAAAVVDAVRARERGTASAMVIIFRLVGMTLGVSAMTAYGLERADRLNSQLLKSGADLLEIARVGMRVAEQVVQETFIFAGMVCFLAVIPVWRIMNLVRKEESDGRAKPYE
jgi:MFS family permease